MEAGCTRALEHDPQARPKDVVLVPGLVNAHAHLDLAGSGAVPAGATFPDWLLAIGTVRGAERDVASAARDEASHLAERGVVALGDVDGSAGAGTAGRRRAGIGGRSYLEIVGVAPESARARLVETLRYVDRLGGGARDLGLSPHAPYSVHASVVPEIVRAAATRDLPLAMHLAETPEETRFLTRGDGPFRRFLDTIDRGDPFAEVPGVRPVEYAEQTGFLAAGGVVVHGNDLSDDDIGRLVRHGTSVVYCHGTHRHFDRPRHRINELMEAGLDVALGTDSCASNDGIDLFAELQRLASDRPDLDPLRILTAATRGGRRALRLPEGPADWQPGSAADGVLLGPAPEETESMDASALAEWAMSGDARVLSTLHTGVLRSVSDASREGLVGQLDSLS